MICSCLTWEIASSSRLAWRAVYEKKQGPQKWALTQNFKSLIGFLRGAHLRGFGLVFQPVLFQVDVVLKPAQPDWGHDEDHVAEHHEGADSEHLPWQFDEGEDQSNHQQAGQHDETHLAFALDDGCGHFRKL